MIKVSDTLDPSTSWSASTPRSPSTRSRSARRRGATPDATPRGPGRRSSSAAAPAWAGRPSVRLAEEGAHVYVADLSLDAAKTVERRDRGGRRRPPRACQLDATDNDALRAFYARIDAEHGKLHVLHNQVGMPGAGGLDVSEADFDRAIEVNVKTAFYVATLGYELVKKADRKGSITMTASTAALVGSPFSPLYSLTKGALTAYTRALALVGGPDGVRVNVICPGPVDTPMLPTFFGRDPGADMADLMERLHRPHPPADGPRPRLRSPAWSRSSPVTTPAS